MKVLITGAAGFIGSGLSLRLLERGDEVIGIDNLNDYYDVELKKARLARTLTHPNFTDVRINIEDRDSVAEVFHMLMSIPTWLASPISWRAVGTMMSNTWCMPPAVPYTVPTQICRFPCMTMLTTR